MAKIEDIKEFTIVPDVRMFKMLRDEMRAVVGELGAACATREISARSSKRGRAAMRPFPRDCRRREPA